MLHTASAHTVWLRVSSFAAGSGFGFVSTPRIGQEVLVSFYDDDPDHPIVIGVAFNPRHMTPYPLPKHKTKTVLRTQTHQGEGFNELSFEDEAGKEDIYTRAQKDMHTLVLNDQDAIIKHDKSTLVEHDMSTTVIHDQTNHIQHDMSTLVDHDQINRVKNDQHDHVDHDYFHQVKNNAHYTVEGESRVHLKSQEHHTVDMTSHQKFEEKLLVKVADEYHIKTGSKIVIDAGAEITLKVGGSFIRIDASGVHLVGPSVNINGGGSAGNGTPAEPLVPLDSVFEDLPTNASVILSSHPKGQGVIYDNEPYELYKNGKVIKKGLSDEEGAVKFEREEEAEYKVVLSNGHEFKLGLDSPEMDDHIKKLSRSGFRAYDFKTQSDEVSPALDNKDDYRRSANRDVLDVLIS